MYYVKDALSIHFFGQMSIVYLVPSENIMVWCHVLVWYAWIYYKWAVENTLNVIYDSFVPKKEWHTMVWCIQGQLPLLAE